MQNVSNEFREKVYSGEALYTANLVINGQQVPINQIAKITIKSPIIDTSTETFYVGSFISQSITIKFKNLDGIDIQSNNLVYLEIGQLINDEYEYVPIGYFLIDDLAENYQTTCEITCLDFAVKFKPNIDYSPCFVNGKADLNTIAQYICDYFGVELETDLSQLPNPHIETGMFNNTISGKQWLSYIAETKGCNLKLNRLGKLVFVPLKHAPSVTINALKSEKWEIGEKYQISRVIYFDAVRNYTQGDETANTLYIRQDNPFITGEDVVENIYNSVEGFTVYSVKNRNYGDVSLDAWDIIDFTVGYDENNNLVHIPTYNDNVTVYEMNIMTDISTQIQNKQKEVTTNIIGGDEATKLKKVLTNLDYVNGIIELLIAEQNDTQGKLNKTIMDIEKTQNIFQVTGGNNLIKNSQFLYNDTEQKHWTFSENGNNPYNNMGNGYDAELIGKTTSIAKIQLRDIISETTVQNIKDLIVGQIYTLSYSYKQDDLTTTRFELLDANDNYVTYDELVTIQSDEDIKTQEIQTKDLNIEYINQTPNITSQVFQFKAPTSTLKLKITTETTDANDGYFYLYDLMLSSGEKTTWGLASDEIYSTVIQLSQLGLQVITENANIATLLTSQGFQIRKYENGTFGVRVTEFTKNGLITDIAETNEVHTGKYVMKDITINNLEHHFEYFKGE